MELTQEIEHAVAVTASTMLVDSTDELPLVFHEDEFKLVVKNSKASEADPEKVLHEFPISDKIFQLLHK